MANACEGLLWILLWENVNDPGVRARIRRALGFCPRHTLRLCQVAQAEGLGMTGPAIIFADVLGTLRTRLQTCRAPARSEGPCPVCTNEQAVAGDGVFAVLQYVKHPSLGALIRERGLCRPHYRMAGTVPGQDEARAELQAYQEEALARRGTVLGTGASGAIARASAVILRGDAPWPPRRSSGKMGVRRGTAEQAAYVASILRAEVACPICLSAACPQGPHEVRLAALPCDSPERAAFVAAGGVCSAHAGVLDALSADALRDLYGATWQAARGTLAIGPARTRSWLRGRQDGAVSRPPCPLCAQAERAAHVLAERLARDPPASSAAYCLPHLRLVLQAVPRHREPVLRAHQASRLRELMTELGEMVRKSDWQHRDEPKGDEQRAWVRGAAFFAAPWLVQGWV
jgi:hypothetical protein